MSTCAADPFVFREAESTVQTYVASLEADGDLYWAAKFRALPRVVDAHTAGLAATLIAEKNGVPVEKAAIEKPRGRFASTLMTLLVLGVFIFLVASGPAGWAVLLIIALVGGLAGSKARL